MKSKITGILSIAVGMFASVMLGEAQAADYPEKPITVVVQASAGGGTDTLARTMWKHAGRISGATFVVENHSGAGGQIGYTKLATSNPDGYTLGATNTMSITTHELTRDGVVYKLKESFSFIGRGVLDPSVVAVRADSDIQSLEDLLAAAKSEPGKLTWGGTFLFGTHHVHYRVLNDQTGAEMQYIPFDGSSETKAALLGGHVDVGSGGFSEFTSLLKEGKVRVLAIAANDRWVEFPEVPTYGDLGYDIVLGSNRGYAVPAGTPDDRVQWLSDLIGQTIADPEFRADAEKVGIAPILAHLDGEAFGKYLYSLQDIMAELLKEK